MSNAPTYVTTRLAFATAKSIIFAFAGLSKPSRLGILHNFTRSLFPQLSRVYKVFASVEVSEYIVFVLDPVFDVCDAAQLIMYKYNPHKAGGGTLH